MLTTKFATHLQPVIKEVWTRLDNLQRLQRDVLIALCLVIAIDLLQTLIEQRGKLLEIRGLL